MRWRMRDLLILLLSIWESFGLWYSSSQDARKSFRDNVSVGSWFSILKEASSEFHCEKRIAWVETEGIPFKLWTENTFKRIASRWGVFLSVDDQEDS
ncbi:nucleotide-binding alpha-beta plait domain-containing protein, partial [Tanacetum coccineum]